ncbi:Ferredoxin I [Hydrogenophaga sp. T4]|nr:Ferredoxin I [Hydrogenophaga sp. T4]
MPMKIIASTCTACSACEPECPNVAIREKGGTYVIDPKKCTDCEATTTSRNASPFARSMAASSRSEAPPLLARCA